MYQDDGSPNANNDSPYLKESDIDKWILNKIPVFKLLDPEDKYKLIYGDILY
jgi:hypothetical protein